MLKLSSNDFFFKIGFFPNSFRKIDMSEYQIVCVCYHDRRSVCPDLGPNFFAKVIGRQNSRG